MEVSRSFFLAFALLASGSMSTLAQTQTTAPVPKSPSTPQPQPVGPPTPPTGPFPWKTPDRDRKFFTDKEAVKNVMDKSNKPSLVLEDYQLTTKRSFELLAKQRSTGNIDEATFQREAADYENAMRIYRDLSKSK